MKAILENFAAAQVSLHMTNTRLFYPSCGPMPYESIYSIYLKLSYMNFLKLRALGAPLEVGTSKQWEKHELTSWLQNNVLDIHKHLPWNYLDDTRRRGGLLFCKKCVGFGYHSVFNEIASHHVCILHKCELSEACNVCRYAYTSGFLKDSAIPFSMAPCTTCGFQHIAICKELRMRRSRSLIMTLERYGFYQDEWYSAINRLDRKLAGDTRRYWVFSDFREQLTGPFEGLTNLMSPETLLGVAQDKQPFALVREYVGEADPLTYWKSEPAFKVFEKIERRYLEKHQDCLRLINQVLDYPSGFPVEADLCPMALAYLLLRIKCLYEIWPIPGSTKIPLGRFYAKDRIGYAQTYRSATISFLSLIGLLQYHISKGENFLLLRRPPPYIGQYASSYSIIRKSSYTFRSLCRSHSACIKVFRDGFGGPLHVISDFTEPPDKGVFSVKRVVF